MRYRAHGNEVFFSICLNYSLCPEQWLLISVACINEWMGTWTLGRTTWGRYWVWCCASIVSLMCGCYQLDRDSHCDVSCPWGLSFSLSVFLEGPPLEGLPSTSSLTSTNTMYTAFFKTLFHSQPHGPDCFSHMTHAFCFLLCIPDTASCIISSFVKDTQITSSLWLVSVTGSTSPPTHESDPPLTFQDFCSARQEMLMSPWRAITASCAQEPWLWSMKLLHRFIYDNEF